jgi:acetyl-CoA C-acetyltransferase
MKRADVVAVSAVRTPMGKFGGTLKDVPVYDLGAAAIRGAVQKAGISADVLDEVILGHCRQAGNGPNPARSAARKADVPVSVPANSLNMACPSGMKAVALGAQAIQLGDSKVVVAGGMDSMSTIPYLLKGVRFEGFKMGDKTLLDGWSDSIDPIIETGMGGTAENLVEKYDIPRAEMDSFAVESHTKAARAIDQGWFEDEIVPFVIPGTKKAPEVVFAVDETPRRDTSVEQLGKLPAVFRKGGRVTAGNACGMSDGATAIVLTSRDHAKALGLRPLFSIASFAQTAVDNATMGEGPGFAIPMALGAAGMKLADMDLVEVNEAFAVQVLVNERTLGWDRAKLNVHGGAIALGHPTGISGARILVTLAHALRRLDKEHGVASICGGGGVTMAMVIRREA